MILNISSNIDNSNNLITVSATEVDNPIVPTSDSEFDIDAVANLLESAINENENITSDKINENTSLNVVTNDSNAIDTVHEMEIQQIRDQIYQYIPADGIEPQFLHIKAGMYCIMN